MPQSPEGEDLVAVTFTKEPSVIEHKAYRDTWGRGLESYLQCMPIRLRQTNSHYILVNDEPFRQPQTAGHGAMLP